MNIAKEAMKAMGKTAAKKKVVKKTRGEKICDALTY